MASIPGLLVPVDLTGYCLGTIDAAQAEKFVGATTWYSQMSGTCNATLGSNVTRGLDMAPAWPLEAGVHLHWAMPDGLTHGQSGATSVDFAALPNRWLLTRVCWVDDQSVTKAWVILSDMLSTSLPDNTEGPSLPVQDAAQNFRYLGVAEDFDANWQEPVIAQANAILALFGSPLHTVASGDVAFAAFYPNARNVFGFYDDMTGVDTSAGDAKLMYSLVGWYADASHDPLNGQPALADLQKTYRWTCGAYPDPAPNYSLYHGQVQNLAWNPATRYIVDNSTPVDATVAIGNNPAETLAAYFNGLNQETLPHFDTLFTGFEIGALAELMQPKAGQWSALQETLHARQFNGQSGGTIFTVQALPASAQSKDDQRRAPPPLPPALGDALNLLNQYQQEFDLAGWERQQYYGQLFSGWYRIVQISQDDCACAYNALSDLLAQNAAVQDAYAHAQTLRDNQQAAVVAMLPAGMELVAQPGPSFLAPNEPCVLLSGDMFDAPRRYGGDGLHHEQGQLVCRVSDSTVTALVLQVGGVAKPLDASQFGAVKLPSSNHLAYAADIDALLLESCLLNTSVAASLCGADPATLETDLAARLCGAGASGNSYQSFTGTPPSPVAVQWLDGNPWLPMFLSWTLYYYPLLNTEGTDAQGNLNQYGESFFTDNFSVDPNAIGTIPYVPGSGGIQVDPSRIDFSETGAGIQVLKGASILSPSASDTLEDNIARYLLTHQDASLTLILQQLQDSAMLMQSLSGLNAGWLMHQEALQLTISSGADPGTPVANLTKQVQRIVTDLSQLPPMAPLLNGHYNPLRAGFFTFTGEIVDVFGQKRPLNVQQLCLADTLTTVYQGSTVKDVVYLQPRLAQPSRLLFRWLAADSTGYEEMNFHPATTPVCGWLLTNHLNGGVFIYDQTGRPLGSLTPSLDNSRIVWQSAPGDDDTVDQSVAQVMAGQNPYLANVVTQLAGATPAWFGAFWKSVDVAAGKTTPLSPSSDVGLGTLIGSPLALVQASLLLEQQGFAALNLGWDTIDRANQNFLQTDNGLSTVQFPVVLGDLEAIDDGLIGYFKQDPSGDYVYGSFYTESADGSDPGVLVPAPDNLMLTPHADAPGSAPSVSKGESKVLMLVDPRAGIHVSSGILPTQFLRIPASQFQDVLRSLEMTFLVAPVLQPASQVALPLAPEKDYAWSWIDEQRSGGKGEWMVTADIAPPAANALWSYSPQLISEGWLRLNPLALRFALTTQSGQRAVRAGTTVDLVLSVSNLLSQSIAFTPATIVHEGSARDGAIFYIHFGTLVQASDVAGIDISADGWTFTALQDARYGNYWAATAASAGPVSLAAGASVQMAVRGVPVSPTADGCCKVYFDYYRVTGMGGDGVAIAALGIQNDHVNQLEEEVSHG